MKVGERVGVLFSLTHTKAKLIGYGTYVGYETPDESLSELSAMLSDNYIPDHKIRLDNGEVVWGHQCARFAQESVVKNKLATLEEVTLVNIKGELRDVR